MAAEMTLDELRDYIHSMDPEYWSEEDKRMADIMAADSY